MKIPGEGHGNPLKYSHLQKSMDGGAWWATVHGVTKSQTRLSNFTSLLIFILVTDRGIDRRTALRGGVSAQGLSEQRRAGRRELRERGKQGGL